MIKTKDPIVQADFDAYVDDQLDAARRIEVAGYLSEHPEVAARVMADLRVRDELRLALSAPSSVSGLASAQAAERLQRSLGRRQIFNRLQRVAAVALLVGLGWMAHAGFGPLVVSEVVASQPAPAYVEDAVMAHRTSLMRAAMPSQPGTKHYDPAEIRAATAIVMPKLPSEWKVKDVQLFPSTFGPSIELEIGSDRDGALSLFAVRPGSFDVVKPRIVGVGDMSAAYFQIGEVAYALVANAGSTELDKAANQLANTLY
ncbi:anti-sigma factor [Phyllobacterium sp. YR531]|uniref:anti-sigma factor family protein n=1 Tax=Phyllobacterium sp. YR531 TaxID=1144343 RepID=UPI00026F9845|nr:anti-sigma factor [Phyllobacterium sp. YR531]EJN06102.1 putative transmembrane transcriptional regulator (anti-sigma factor) [Phyllobacterium sp. YR531]